MSSAQNNSITYYHQDGLGSVVALSDENGAIVERYRYTAFGAVTIRDAAGNTINTTAHGNRFLYTGREYFQNVNLYDYRNRIYSPSLGRFLQTDPIRFGFDVFVDNKTGNWEYTQYNTKRLEIIDINLYRYVKNNALNYIDPWGLKYEKLCCELRGGKWLRVVDCYYNGDWSRCIAGECADTVEEQAIIFIAGAATTKFWCAGGFLAGLGLGTMGCMKYICCYK